MIMSNKDSTTTERNQDSEHKYGQSFKHDYDYRTVGIVGTASFCVVLPKEYAISLGVGKGDFVKVSREQNRIVIEKA
jgi:hypothetical protein